MMTEPSDDTAPLPRAANRRAYPLSLRLTAIFALVVAATLFVVAGLAVWLTRAHLSRSLERQLRANVQSFESGPGRSIDGLRDLERDSRRWLTARAAPGDFLVAVRTASGDVLTSSTGLDLHGVEGAREALEATTTRRWTLQDPQGPIRGISVPIVLGGRQLGTLVAGVSEAGLEATTEALLLRIGWGSLAGLAFAAIVGFATVRRALNPLSRMTRDIEEIQQAGDLTGRVHYRGPRDEVGTLAGAFNRMLSRLEEAFRSQQTFLSDASHELRTPLTIARGQLELLQDQTEGIRARRSLQLGMSELDRMSRIVDDLLLLARVDEGGLTLTPSPVEVELVLQEALVRSMQSERRRASVEAESGLYVLADPDRLLQALINLIMNALRHTPDSARIALMANRADGLVAIHVSDTGPGIPDDELPHVFERLYRGSSARESAAGAGLGLAIVASLVKAMGGGIDAASSPGEGTTFTLTLPAAEAPVSHARSEEEGTPTVEPDHVEPLPDSSAHSGRG